MRATLSFLCLVVLGLPAAALAGQSVANGSFEDGTNNGWTVWAQTWAAAQTGPQTVYHNPPAQTDLCGHGLAAPDGQYFGGISYVHLTPEVHGHVLFRQVIEVKNWDPAADRVNYEFEIWSQVSHSREYQGYEPRQEHILWWAPDGEMPKDTAFVAIRGTIAEGDTIEIDTGGANRVYEFDTDAILRDPGNVAVTVAALDAATAKTALVAAINNDALAPCTASNGAKVVVLLWKATNSNGATNTNLNDTNSMIDVYDFSFLPGTPQYETNQNKQYVEDVPIRSATLSFMKAPTFLQRNASNQVQQCFTNWRKIKVGGSVPANPKVVVLEIRLKTDARLAFLHSLFDGVVFSAQSSTGSLIGDFYGDIPNSDFEIEPYNTRHHGCPGKGTPAAWCVAPDFQYDPPAGWGDIPPLPDVGYYSNLLRDWGRDAGSAGQRGPIEGYTNGVTSPTDPLGSTTPSGEHFWGRANPGGASASGLQGYWGHVVTIRNWSPTATGFKFKLRYRTLMTDVGGGANQLMELCWGDTEWAAGPGAEGGTNTKTQPILSIGTDDPRNANLCSTNVATLPWMRILYFNDSLIRDACAVRGFVEIERTGEFSPTDLDGAPYCPQHLLLRNATYASPDGSIPFKLFYDAMDFYAEAIGGCGDLPADFDKDGDVDHVDFSQFQVCYTGASGGVPAQCFCADLNGDGVGIGQADVEAFAKCASGPGIPADPTCDNQACCLTVPGCLEIPPGECLQRGGTPQGVGITCTPDPCP